MTSAKHTHTIHIDAPVEKVFAFIAEPKNLMETYAAGDQAKVVQVNQKPDGTVASYKVQYRELGMHLTAEMTREEYVADQRFTDHSSMGPVWSVTVAPDTTGTALSFEWDASRLMKLLDAVLFHSDKDFDPALDAVKKEVEALP
jgi:hypothetical protein